MRPGPIARRIVLLGLGAVCAGCAAAPLTEARGRYGQTASQTAWDSRACGWEAQDASGYQIDLSPDENAAYNVFAYAWPDGPWEGSDPLLGRGGKARFDQVFRECMAQRGYEVPQTQP
jgi:hypothetical protein